MRPDPRRARRARSDAGGGTLLIVVITLAPKMGPSWYDLYVHPNQQERQRCQSWE